MEKYDVPATVMIEYLVATNTLSMSEKDQFLDLNCQDYENKNRAFRQRFLANDDLVQASNNYERILELPVIAMIAYDPTCTEWWLSFLEEGWAPINRGNDLFVRGMGGFNIPQAYSKAVASRHTEWKRRMLGGLQDYDLELICSSLNMTKTTREDILHASVYVVQIATIAIQAGHPRKSLFLELRSERGGLDGKPYWLLGVRQLQTWGYFGNAMEKMTSWEASCVELNVCKVLALPKDSPQRQHLIRYHHSWKEQANLASLYEIKASFEKVDGFWPNGWELMKPSTLLNALREHERETRLATAVMRLTGTCLTLKILGHSVCCGAVGRS